MMLVSNAVERPSHAKRVLRWFASLRAVWKLSLLELLFYLGALILVLVKLAFSWLAS